MKIVTINRRNAGNEADMRSRAVKLIIFSLVILSIVFTACGSKESDNGNDGVTAVNSNKPDAFKIADA